MKYCPNPDCRQEYRDEAVACADCGAQLTLDQPDWAAEAATVRPLPWIKLALTLGVPFLAAEWAPRMRLPRIDWDKIEGLGDLWSNQPSLSPFALGLGPMISAFLFVELAALCVPRWRPLRTGGPRGRGRLLEATGWLGLVLASVQGLGFVVYMARLGWLERDARLSALVVVITLVAGTFVLVGVAGLLDRWALGGGYSLLITAFVARPMVPPLSRIDPQGAAVVLLLLAVAGTVLILRWRPKGALPLPASGVLPLQWSASLVAIPAVLSQLGVWPEALGDFALGPAAGWSLARDLALTAATAVGLGVLFNRPSRVAAFSADAPSRVRRAVGYSTAYVLGLAVFGWLIGGRLDLHPFSLVPVVVVTAAVLDVVAEAQAVRHHGELVPVWPEHRVYAVESALLALERAGIPALARSVHQRALWHFFAPYVPIQILVPQSRAEEASSVLHEHFLAADARPISIDDLQVFD